MTTQLERKRNHAALILVAHGNDCDCDLCRASVEVLRATLWMSSVCSCCGVLSRPDEDPSDLCVDCQRARGCLDVDSCPRCAHPHGIVLVPRQSALRCSQCGWTAPSVLARGLRTFPTVRLVQENLDIQF